MSRRKQSANVAFVEEAEDESSSIEGFAGTRIYAMSEAPDPPPRTPSKQLANSSRSRRGEASVSSSDSASRSAEKQREKERKAKESKRQKEKDRQQREAREDERYRRAEEKRENEIRRAKAEARAAKDSSQALKKVRPQAPRHSTQPVVQQSSSYRRGHVEEPSYYGIPQPASSNPRPRANTRPASYYAGQTRGPPPSSSWQNGPMGPPPSHFGVGSFPGPPPMYAGGPPPPGVYGGPPQSPSGRSSYFDSGPPTPMHQSRDLRQRFDYRPSSAMGHQSPASRSYPREDYFEYDDEPQQSPARVPRNRRQQEEDRKRMPPPPMKTAPQNMPRRPSTTANSTPFQPPPRPSSRHEQSRPRPANRRSVGFTQPLGFDDDDLAGGDDGLFHDISPQPNPPTDYRRRAMSQSRNSRTFDEDHEVMPAHGRSQSRRGSMYGSNALGSGGASLESGSKYLDAVRYQDEVGGPPQPLTAESLRKANKRGEGVASSRSTRSSGSRDESEYKRSSTTGITRSSSGANDDFTIKVSGAAVVRVHGAEIECEDSEITFSNATGSGRNSEQSSTVYQLEDGRSSHRERKALPLPYRTRAPSQSDSQSRGYAPSYAPYEPSYYL